MNPNLLPRRRLRAGEIGLCRDANGGPGGRPQDTGGNANPFLAPLYQQRQQALDLAEAAVSQARQANDGQGRDLSDVERKTISDAQTRVKALDDQIELIEGLDQARAAGTQAAQTFRPTVQAGAGQGQQGGQTGMGYTQPRAYEYRSAGEVIADLVVAHDSSMMVNTGFARTTPRHVELAQARLMGAQVEFAGAPESYTRALAHAITADVPGLLPKPIIGEIVNDLDAARPFVESIGAKDLSNTPGKTFTRPHITQHVDVQKQTAEKAEVVSRKLLIDGIDFTKETWGGGLNVSRQDIDWTSPSAWDAIVTDLQEVYGINTENAAADAFAAAVTAVPIVPATDDLRGWYDAIYAAAAAAYGVAKRLPNHMWMSLDMWAKVGPVIDSVVRQNGGSGGGSEMGSSSPTSFAGRLADTDRTVVPSFPAGTFIIGVKERTEFYEERIGLLTAVQPSVLGVEVAYGGYAAYGTLKPGAFAKVGAFVPAP